MNWYRRWRRGVRLRHVRRERECRKYNRIRERYLSQRWKDERDRAIREAEQEREFKDAVKTIARYLARGGSFDKKED